MKSKKMILCLFLIVSSFFTISGQPITSTEIDNLVERTMKTFEVPGIAVAIVKDGKILHAKGYGVRSLSTNQKVDENTLFAIASNSKAFTAAALGILVDEGKISWDDKVIDFIPEFRLYNPFVTEEFTIRDLLTHRSGLGLGAGDLMIWPGTNNFSIKDIIYNLRFLKQVSGFRTKFDYDNLLYIVAGEVVARVSKLSWEEFIEKKIMQPLNMSKSAASYDRLKDKSNVIDPHAKVNDKLQVITRDMNDNSNAAGGIYSNLTDMCKWVLTHINSGKYGDGLSKHMWTEKTQDEMWTLQTVIPVKSGSAYNTHFSGYGLGWFLNDVKGYKQASHTGGLAGIVTQVTIIPELKLGIIVLTNQQVGAAFNAITNTIKDSYLNIKATDRIKQYHESLISYENYAKKMMKDIWVEIENQKKNNSNYEANIFIGNYADKWFGDIEISMKNNQLRFDSKKSPKLKGEMIYYKANTFIVKWDDRSFDADAFFMFSLDNKGKAVSAKMEAISPLTDFSYDFQDLDFKKIDK